MRVNFWKSGPIKAARRKGLACAVACATALALTSLTTATTGTASAASGSPADYTVASFSFETHSGVAAVITSFDGGLCPVPPSESLFCPAPRLVFPGFTTSGTTIWTDANSPNFQTIVDELTNGESDVMSWDLIARAGSTDVAESATSGTERDFLDGQVGPSGVDLAGYTIDRIGLRADEVLLDSPGSDPNHNGIWTDFVFRGTFLFEGRIASADACKNGGWQSLHGPDGTSFHNQGQCIRLVRTGK